jgi:hypothetical protein
VSAANRAPDVRHFELARRGSGYWEEAANLASNLRLFQVPAGAFRSAGNGSVEGGI